MTDLNAIDGWLAPAEGELLTALAADVLEGQVIVELGSYRGKSACFLASGSERGNKRPVYCVDLWTLGGQWESTEERRAGGALHQEDPAHYEAFRKNTEPYRERIVEVNRDSKDAGRAWIGGRSIGLLFVDADHSYEGTLADLEAWSPHVVPGGIIACHDYRNQDYPGVAQAVDEFFDREPYAYSWLTESMIVVQTCAT